MIDNTEHEKALNIAIKDQTKLGWHLFLRGMHAKSWNTAYLTWMKEKKEESLNMQWNHYTIKLMVNFTISIWAKRCMDTNAKL